MGGPRQEAAAAKDIGMVGSKFASGLCRDALCETLESRNLFSSTVGLDTKFGNGGTVTTDFGTSLQYGYLGVVLKDGRLLTAGVTSRGNDDLVTLVAYNKDGSLSQSFGVGGKLTLSAADQAKLAGGATGLFQAADGGILLTGGHGVLKLTLAGKDDTTYGVGGFTALAPPAAGIYSVNFLQKSDGTVQEVYYDNSATRLYVRDINAAGKITLSIQRTIGLKGSIAGIDANSITVLSGMSVYRFNTSDISKISSFGTGGVLDLTAAYDKWAVANGPFYSSSDTQHKNPIVAPALYLDGNFDAKAGIGVRGEIQATSPTVQSEYGSAATVLNFAITPDGKSVTITANEPVGPILAHNDAVVADFESSTFGATFYGTDGTVATVDAFTDFPTTSNVTSKVVFAPDGSAYLIGEAAVKTADGYKEEWAVAKTTVV